VKIEPALEALLAADRAEGFVLNRAPLMRLSAIHLPDGGVQMIWTFHHLLIDGWCLPLIFTEVMAAYEAFRNGVEMLVTAGHALSPLYRLARAPGRHERPWHSGPGCLPVSAARPPSRARRKAALMSRARPVSGGCHAPRPKRSTRCARTGT
jgi:hypothetical protein